MSDTGGGSAESGDDGAGDDSVGDDGAGDNVEPIEYDPTNVDSSMITPIAALIVVAFTGAVIGLLGAAMSFFFGDFGLALVGVGVVVALSSPIAYLRLRRRWEH